MPPHTLDEILDLLVKSFRYKFAQEGHNPGGKTFFLVDYDDSASDGTRHRWSVYIPGGDEYPDVGGSVDALRGDLPLTAEQAVASVRDLRVRMRALLHEEKVQKFIEHELKDRGVQDCE